MSYKSKTLNSHEEYMRGRFSVLCLSVKETVVRSSENSTSIKIIQALVTMVVIPYFSLITNPNIMKHLNRQFGLSQLISGNLTDNRLGNNA